MAMRIRKIEKSVASGAQTITAHIDNLTFWIRFPEDLDVRLSDASPFVISALAPAMMRGEDIVVDDPYTVSPTLLDNLPEVQAIYTTWNPVFKPVNVRGSRVEPAPRDGSVCSFFSGGVDSTYSLLTHRDEISHLIVINGLDFDMPVDDWVYFVNRNRTLAEKFGKRLVPVETNRRSFNAAFGLSGYVNFGASLATIGQLLGFSKTLVSGSATYESLVPCGSHPLVDPLYGTASSTVVHTGLEADRTAKLKLIQSNCDALENLWVCWKSPRVNCGKCSKCLRTFVSMQLNGINDFPFAHRPRIKDIRRITIRNREILTFFEHFLRDAKQKNQRQLARELSRLLFFTKLRMLLNDLEQTYFRKFRAWRHRRKPEGDDLVSVNLEPRYSDENTIRHHRELLHRGYDQEVTGQGSYFHEER